MSIDKAALEAELTEVESVLRQLVTGMTVTEADYAGHRTRFAKPNEAALRRRIREIRRLLGQGSAGSRRVMF